MIILLMGFLACVAGFVIKISIDKNKGTDSPYLPSDSADNFTVRQLLIDYATNRSNKQNLYKDSAQSNNGITNLQNELYDTLLTNLEKPLREKIKCIPTTQTDLLNIVNNLFMSWPFWWFKIKKEDNINMDHVNVCFLVLIWLKFMIEENIPDIALLMTYDEPTDKVTIINTTLVSIFIKILEANNSKNNVYQKIDGTIVLTLMNFHAAFKQFVYSGFGNLSSAWESASSGTQEIPDITCDKNM